MAFGFGVLLNLAGVSLGIAAGMASGDPRVGWLVGLGTIAYGLATVAGRVKS